VQCFFPTLYQVLLFDFSSFGEKLFFCLRGYAAQSRSDAQTALLPKTQPAAPYAAETSRYVPPLYTYPTKFMHNLCHIVM